MLVLARKSQESIFIGDSIEVSVVEIKGDQVKLGIRAPADIKVFRKEVFEAIQAENIKASQVETMVLPKLPLILPNKNP